VSGGAAQPGVAAERLDRGDFAMQMQENAVPIYRRDPSSRPLNAKPLGRWVNNQTNICL
jgi:hypothetical protein